MNAETGDLATQVVEEAPIMQINLLTDIEPGQVVTIKTTSGSTYWIVKVKDSEPTNGDHNITGLSISTTSRKISGRGGFQKSPYRVQGQAVIEVGSLWYFGARGHTSIVTEISL